MSALAAIQERFLEVLEDRRPPDEGRHGFDPRIRIHWWMYSARLRDVLRGDYPRVAAVLGDATFDRLADDYLRAHPSRHACLHWFGERFAGFVEHRAKEHRPDAADLARLDWARVEAFDAADEAPLDLSDPAWPERILRTVSSVRIVETSHAIEALWLAADRREPAQVASPVIAGEQVLVWRSNLVVRHRLLDSIEREALGLLERPVGATFIEICAVFARTATLDEAVSRAALAMAQWAADHLLTYGIPA